MRLSRSAPFVVVVLAKTSFAQVPAPAAEPAPAPAAAPAQAAPQEPPAPPEPAPPAEPAPPVAQDPAPAPEPPAPPSEPAARPEPPTPVGPAPEVGATDKPAAEPAVAPWKRVNSPLTLEGGIGFVARPESSGGFQDESRVGSVLFASLYMDLKKEIAAGIEIERAALGRGTAISGLDSVSVDYTVSSAMLGFRAYPLRRDFLDVFVGLQVGVGVQGVSATGTENNGALLPASSYTCGATDSPAFQLGGGVGARLMLSEHWGLTARVNGTGRRLSGEMIDECARGLGTATTISGTLGLGYDFELDP